MRQNRTSLRFHRFKIALLDAGLFFLPPTIRCDLLQVLYVCRPLAFCRSPLRCLRHLVVKDGISFIHNGISRALGSLSSLSFALV